MKEKKHRMMALYWLLTYWQKIYIQYSSLEENIHYARTEEITCKLHVLLVEIMKHCHRQRVINLYHATIRECAEEKRKKENISNWQLLKPFSAQLHKFVSHTVKDFTHMSKKNLPCNTYAACWQRPGDNRCPIRIHQIQKREVKNRKSRWNVKVSK